MYQSSRKKRIEYLKNIKYYLRNLSILTSQVITESKLTSVGGVVAFRELKEALIKEYPIQKKIIPFSKKKVYLAQLFIKLHNLNDESIYIWIKGSEQCGLCEIDSLMELDLNFPFDFYGEIIMLSTVDAANQVVLDFYNDEITEDELLQVEVSGVDWKL